MKKKGADFLLSAPFFLYLLYHKMADFSSLVIISARSYN